jgi:hypothetical protein
VFRHVELSKTSRESFDLAGKLLDNAERLLGDLDPKVPIGGLIVPGHVGRDGALLARFDRLTAPGIGVADPVSGAGMLPLASCWCTVPVRMPAMSGVAFTSKRSGGAGSDGGSGLPSNVGTAQGRNGSW